MFTGLFLLGYFFLPGHDVNLWWSLLFIAVDWGLTK
jgi:hypothetical protein